MARLVIEKWLVYCKYVDKVYCFCGELFKSSTSRNLSLLASEDDLSDCKHISRRLKKHESSLEHMTNKIKQLINTCKKKL